MSHLATLIVHERHGIARDAEAIRIGVPLARGALADGAQAALFDAAGRALPAQFRALATWPDRSVRWLLVDARVGSAANAEQRLSIRRAAPVASASGVQVRHDGHRLRIDTGAAVFELAPGSERIIEAVTVQGVAALDARGLALRVRGQRGAALSARIAGCRIEAGGPVLTTVLASGVVEAGGRELARLKVRLAFEQESAAVRLDCEVWNPRAARHPGGLWDLGDSGSLHFADLSLEVRPAQAPQGLEWQATPGEWQKSGADPWSVYQDSSGGERWNSPNHVDGNGRLTVAFRGYRVHAGGGVLGQGDRATPAVRVTGPAGSVCASVEKFWQNFPKALRWDGQVLGIGLFPAECAAGFELQGGEKKRHTVLLDFTHAGAAATVALHAPLGVTLDPVESAGTSAAGYLLPAARDGNATYLDYVGSILEGAHAFSAKRELIDEYGWRHFGELYADHEAVNHRGPEPFISHYNNQYDFVAGAALHFLRTGDARWYELMVDAARHHIDIDIYHTQDDKAAFNGGLFWHTDHYHPAATCSHRTYSRRNARGPYGGGPSNEHNYTSGLLQYHYLTGDPEAASAVLELADWVMAMDDGGRTLFAVADDGPSGLASKSSDPTFHKPGRGAGNSINALLDAYALTRQRRYLQFAEALLQRVIHPHDDVPAIGFDKPETRWSYLVFLQVLGKYLDRKLEWGETDYLFWYARASLLAYARWMSAHEKPYKDVLHKVEIPTETWPAHDVRKCHVFHLAARFAPADERPGFTERARFYFERCLQDLLSFPTAHLTRPQVILCVYGPVHAYYTSDAHIAALPPEPDHDFGAPVVFEIQRARLKSSLRRKAAATWREIRRLARDRLRGGR